MQNKKNIFLWTLYDFANSIVLIVFFLYFAQWLVIDKAIPDLWFNLTFTISAILLLVTVPITGTLLDKYLRRITGLRYATVFTAIFYGLCAIFAILDSPMVALVFYTLGLYFYLFSFTFYTPLLNDISKPGKRGFVSGLGIGANYLGQIAGLLIALPLSTGAINFFNTGSRAETLLPAVIIFFILALPMLIFFQEPHRIRLKERFNLTASIKETVKETKLIFLTSSVAFFMLSYFFFNDAILTASNNFPIFLEQVWHVSDTVKTYILLGILVTSAIGGALGGIIADRFGHKRTLVFILIGWIILLPLLGIINNFTIFIIATVIMGLWFGSNWTVSRSLMSHIAPKGKHNLVFAYFGLAERASALLGPVVWGLIVSGFISMGSFRYRLAVVVIAIFIVVGLFMLLKVKDDRKKEDNLVDKNQMQY